MIFKYSLLLFISICLIGCGGKASKEKTSASFKIYAGAVSDPNLSGGVMVYGRSDTAENFAINVTSDSLSFPIPNGTWDFYVFGWDGVTSMTGTLRCGETSATLDGGDTVVSFNLSDANCSNGSFGAPSFKVANQFKPLRLVHCSDITGVVDGNSNCNGLLSGTKSYEVSLSTFGSVPSAPLTSGCFDDSVNAGGETDTVLNIPTGGLFADFLSLHVSAFKNTSCAGGSIREYDFNSGIEAGEADSVTYSNASYSVIFLEAPVPIVIPGIQFSPMGGRNLATSTSYSIKSTAAVVMKTTDSTSTSYVFKQNRKANVDKLRYSESTNFYLSTGNK